MRRILIVLVAPLIAACGQQSTTTPSAGEEFAMRADNVITFMTTKLTNAGVLAAELEADTGFTYEASRRMDFVNVSVVFYSPQGVQTGTLTSRTADHNTADNIFIAREDVVLITQGQRGERRLETEELHYDIGRDEIWTDSPFVWIEDGRQSRGSRFRTDSQLRIWEVTGIQTEGPGPGQGGITF